MLPIHCLTSPYFTHVTSAVEQLLKGPYANVNLDRRIEQYVLKMDRYLSGLDNRTTKLIANAEDVKEQAKLVSFNMKFEWKNIKECNHSNWWKTLFVNRGWKGKMLERTSLLVVI